MCYSCVTYLALLDDTGKYILNGNSLIQQDAQTFTYGGVTFTYAGTQASIEQVRSKYTRKLTRNLRVQVSQPFISYFVKRDSNCSSILYSRLCPGQMSIRTTK